jgi:hypothetical protein
MLKYVQYIEVGRRFFTVEFCTIKKVSVGVGRVQSALLQQGRGE